MFFYDAKSGVVEVSSDADADDDINLYHDINELSMNLKIFHFNKYRLEIFPSRETEDVIKHFE